MYRRRTIGILNERGYTLVEAIFQLAVFILFSELFVLIILWTVQFQSTTFSKEQTEWELFVNDVFGYLAQGNNIEVINTGQGIRIIENDRTVDIERYYGIVRKQVNEVGHEAMLVDIEAVRFTMQDSKLLLQVDFLNGLQKEREFYVPIQSE